MKILYISALEGGKYTGPIYSVPSQIINQRIYDDVYWINTTNIENASMFDKELYHYCNWNNSAEKKHILKKIKWADLVVFEEFFKIECCIIGRWTEKYKKPYIIIPRCQMTDDYFKHKNLKKKIASLLLFNHFCRKSLAIHFLTKQEQKDSRNYFAGKSIILPNGVNQPSNISDKKNWPNSRNGVFIGRYGIWQKGIDLLIKAISDDRDIIEKNNVIFEFYGPNDRTSDPGEIKELVLKNGLKKIVRINGPVFDEEKEKVLNNACFFVLTSRFEGMPMGVLQALSYGVPCLVTKGTNVSDDIQEDHAGWYGGSSSKDIANAINGLIEDINSSDYLSFRSGALRVAEKYSWKEIAKRSHNVYSDLVKIL